MPTQLNDLLPIPWKDVEFEKNKVTKHYLVSIDHSPIQQNDRIVNSSPEIQALLKQMLSGRSGVKQTVAIMNSLKQLSGETELLTQHCNTVANVIATGFGVGAYLAMQYDKSSGLATLRQQNISPTSIPSAQKPEFEQKQQTAAAICIFTAAYYIVHELSRYNQDEVSNRVVPHVGLPEFSLLNIQAANRCVLFHYGALLVSKQIVPDDVALIRYTIDYFEEVLKEIELYKSSLKYTEEFENRSYKLEDSEFVIRGFNPEVHDTVKSVEFKKVSFDEIVGNRDSKHAARRQIMKLLCYSMEEQKNPMLELGGLARVTLGKGIPGTGKSLIIAAMATELADRCKDLKIPFLFLPFPSDAVSQYQGGSAERVLSWFKPQRDPNKIIFAPVDDAENNFPSRSLKSISAGTREVISVFLTETEGAGAIYRGNTAMPFFSNRPEDLDTAVLSRIEERTDIKGALTWQDFVDQDHAWSRKYEKHMPGFVNLNPPSDYTYFDHQKLVASLNNASELNYSVPKHDGVLEIYHKLSKKFNPAKDDAFYGMFLEELKKKFSFFSSRELRNIQTSVSKRIMDFDFPIEWWEDLSTFFSQKYLVKLQLLTGLMKENMKGLSFGEIRLQEAVRYIDTTVTVYETVFETSVKQRVEEMQINTEAMKRFDEIKKLLEQNKD